MAYEKSIQFDRYTRDYRLLLNGEFVGYARNYHEGEIQLDQLVFELMTHGGADDVPTDNPDVDSTPTTEGPSPLRQPPHPGGMVVVQISDTPILDDVARVIDMALGSTHGAASVISELRRIRARILNIQDRAVTQG